MRRALRTLFAAFLAAALTAAPARAAVVHLRDGGRVEGVVVDAAPRGILVRTARGNERIDSARILRIDFEGAAPPPAYAPPRERTEEELFGPRRHEFSVEAGLTAPFSDVDFGEIGGGSASDGDTGPLFGLQYLIDLAPRWSAGGEFRYAGRGATSSPGLLTNSNASVSGETLLFLGVLKYSLTERGFARPYVLAGAGAHLTSTIIDAAPAPGFAWSDTQTAEARRLVDDRLWGPAGTARIGLDLAVADPSVLTLELGWTMLDSARAAATARGRDLGLTGARGSLDLLTLAVRWGWRF